MARDVSKPHHLPNLRPNKQPPDKSWLPRQRRGTTPQMIGRYPDFDVFDAQDTWDEATSKVVKARLNLDGKFEFFGAGEQPTLRAFCDVAVAQDGEPRVPVPEMVDAKLTAGRLDGYQYDDMPDDRDTWHLVLAGLDEVAEALYGRPTFAVCEPEACEAIVGNFATIHLSGAPSGATANLGLR
jgi:hypothetical protein